MLSEAEFLYFTEVLGVEPFETLDIGPGEVTSDIIVCTPKLSSPEQALLTKILSSIKLTQYEFREIQYCSRAEVLSMEGKHFLTFIDGEELKAPEVIDLGDRTWWRLLPLSSMLTESETLNTERKKQIWSLLQKFALR